MPARGTIDYARPFSRALWFDILPRAAACPDIPARVLLHAGPPYRGAPPAPVVNAAMQALLFENLASDLGEARELLRVGAVELRPAQDHGIVTPLAQVVSSSMLLVAVAQQHHIGYAPVIEGPAPALRFGCVAPACLLRLREVSARIGAAAAPLLRRQPLAVDEVIRVATAAGDECHARTAAANEALVSRLSGLDAGEAAALRANPAFALSVLMAAAAAALQSHGSGIDAIGGNGIDFGVRRKNRAWRQIRAEPPQGTRLAGLDGVAPLGAIGDSAVIDMCGLGGQALGAAPLLAAEWSDTLPQDAIATARALIDPRSGIVDPQRVARAGCAPLINLAILDRDGEFGLIGRGLYRPPPGLFGSGAPR